MSEETGIQKETRSEAQRTPVLSRGWIEKVIRHNRPGIAAHQIKEAITAATAEAQSRIKRMSSALEGERSHVAMALSAIRKSLASRAWLTEGRGPYEWDDAKWYGEFNEAYEEIHAELKKLEPIAADRTDCPETQEEVDNARLKTRIADLERQLEEAKQQATQNYRDAWKVKGDLVRAEAERDQLRADLAAVTKERNYRIAQLNEALNAYEEQVQSLQADLAAAREKAISLARAIDSLGFVVYAHRGTEVASEVLAALQPDTETAKELPVSESVPQWKVGDHIRFFAEKGLERRKVEYCGHITEQLAVNFWQVVGFGFTAQCTGEQMTRIENKTAALAKEDK